jgi:predicted ester cyclase
MSLNANKALIAHLVESINANKFDVLEPHPGFWQTREVVPPMHRAFADWKTTHMQQIAEGDLVFSYVALEFTHIGPFAGVASTGNRVILQGCSLDKVVDGVVVEHNSTTTWPGVFRQLGVREFASWPLRAPRTLTLPPASAPAGPEENKRVLAALPQMIGQGAVPEVGLRNGIGDLMEEFGAIHTAFPDLQADWVAFVAENDLVGVRATLRGTHLGALWGLPPTGKAITWDQFGLARIADGAVVEWNGTIDWISALIQMGYYPAE